MAPILVHIGANSIVVFDVAGIIELEAERDALKGRAEMLEECILEMSEVVYAGD